VTARAAIRVRPRAAVNGVAGRLGLEWKVLVAAPAIEDGANQACVEFFARGLKVPRHAVRITAGRRSRHKRIEIEGITQEALEGFLQKESG